MIALVLASAVAGAASVPVLSVSGSSFVLHTPEGRLTSADMIGAELDILDPSGAPATIRIDAAAPAAERPSVTLLTLSVRDTVTGAWAPYCEPDAEGRRAGFPLAGHWDGAGRYRKDADRWFLTCTSGAQGKCVLWGYDPWSRGAHGQDLAPYYEACTHLVRADYDSRGAAFTREGTTIDIWDTAGIQTPETLRDPAFAFEAGWGPEGAVCVARTRYPDLLPLQVLHQSQPRLAGLCDEAEARRRGALLFNRSR